MEMDGNKLHELSTTKKSLLVDGFCTSYNNYEPIPTDLCSLISTFSKSIIWQISSTTLQQLTPMQLNENSIELNRLSGPIFTTEIGGLKFQLRMERTTTNNIEIQLCFLSGSNDDTYPIKCITMSVSFICNELFTEKRQFCLIDNDYNYIDFYLTNINNIISNYKQLTISCNVQLLSIEYITTNNNNICSYQQPNRQPIIQPKPYIKPIELNKFGEEIKFGWSLNKKMLLKFKNSTTTATTLWPKNNFGINNNFCVYCTPNINGFCNLFLGLLALKYPLNGIYISFKMEIISNSPVFYKKYERKNQWLSCQSNVCWNDNPITYKQLLKLKAFKFVVTVVIVNK